MRNAVTAGLARREGMQIDRPPVMSDPGVAIHTRRRSAAMMTGPLDAVTAVHNAFRGDIPNIDAAARGTSYFPCPGEVAPSVAGVKQLVKKAVSDD
jgi:hypothetical protein